MFVSLSRARTSAPGTTRDCGSVTRPPMLPVLTVSCAAATPAPVSIHKASNSPPVREDIFLLLWRKDRPEGLRDVGASLCRDASLEKPWRRGVGNGRTKRDDGGCRGGRRRFS